MTANVRKATYSRFEGFHSADSRASLASEMTADEVAEAFCFSPSLERLTDGGVSLEVGGSDEDRGASIGTNGLGDHRKISAVEYFAGEKAEMSNGGERPQITRWNAPSSTRAERGRQAGTRRMNHKQENFTLADFLGLLCARKPYRSDPRDDTEWQQVYKDAHGARNSNHLHISPSTSCLKPRLKPRLSPLGPDQPRVSIALARPHRVQPISSYLWLDDAVDPADAMWSPGPFSQTQPVMA